MAGAAVLHTFASHLVTQIDINHRRSTTERASDPLGRVLSCIHHHA